MDKNIPELSIIFPVHNEAEGIENFLFQVQKVLQQIKVPYEIICVENGSIDRSYETLKKISINDSQVLLYKSDKGWGSAVRKGIKKAKGELVCYMVSDNQISPEYIQKVYKAYNNNTADLVKIKRINRENIQRLLITKIYNILAFVAFGIKCKDINGTPKIIKTSLIRSFNLISTNIAFDIELMTKLKKTNNTFIEIPARSNDRYLGTSSTNFKSIIEMLKEMIKLRLK